LALAAYAAGNASDHPIAKLILTEENTATAKGALQHAQEMLTAANAE
jgi:hypothetical protein